MHVAHVAESNLKIVKQLLSLSLCDSRNWARVGFDERQKMAKKFFKITINKKTPTALEELDPIGECRNVMKGEVKEQPFFGEGVGRR